MIFMFYLSMAALVPSAYGSASSHSVQGLACHQSMEILSVSLGKKIPYEQTDVGHIFIWSSPLENLRFIVGQYDVDFKNSDVLHDVLRLQKETSESVSSSSDLKRTIESRATYFMSGNVASSNLTVERIIRQTGDGTRTEQGADGSLFQFTEVQLENGDAYQRQSRSDYFLADKNFHVLFDDIECDFLKAEWPKKNGLVARKILSFAKDFDSSFTAVENARSDENGCRAKVPAVNCEQEAEKLRLALVARDKVWDQGVAIDDEVKRERTLQLREAKAARARRLALASRARFRSVGIMPPAPRYYTGYLVLDPAILERQLWRQRIESNWDSWKRGGHSHFEHDRPSPWGNCHGTPRYRCGR